MNSNLKELLTIGNATTDDAHTAALLMYAAFDEFSNHLFGTKEQDKIIKSFMKLWQMQHNRMSSRYAYIMKDREKPIALISCYSGELINKMFISSFLSVVRVSPRILIYLILHPYYLYVLLTSPEGFKDEFYIFILAVLPEYQNRGIGTKLLEFAEKKALGFNFKKLSLMVRIDNTNALRLYEKFGFKKVGIYEKQPIHSYRMVKELS